MKYYSFLFSPALALALVCAQACATPTLRTPERLTTPAITPPTTILNYYQEWVQDYNKQFKIMQFKIMVCGENHLKYNHNLSEKLIRYNFDSRSSASSYNPSYNQSAFLLAHPDKYHTCIDSKLLNNPLSGYAAKNLGGTIFYGIIKIREPQLDKVSYIPFKTKAIRKKHYDENNVSYELKIRKVANNDKKAIRAFNDDHYIKEVVDWFAQREANSEQIAKLDFINENVELNRSLFSLKLEISNRFDRKTYKGKVLGKLQLPWNQNKTIVFSSAPDIRFPKPGYLNFRKDIRYPKAVSFIPDPDSKIQYSGLTEPEMEVIEIILLPPRTSQ